MARNGILEDYIHFSFRNAFDHRRTNANKSQGSYFTTHRSFQPSSLGFEASSQFWSENSPLFCSNYPFVRSDTFSQLLFYQSRNNPLSLSDGLVPWFQQNILTILSLSVQWFAIRGPLRLSETDFWVTSRLLTPSGHLLTIPSKLLSLFQA